MIGKDGIMNNCYWCYFKTDSDWGCFVVAPERNKAKYMFLSERLSEGEYTDVSSRIIQKDVSIPVSVYDDDCKELGKINVKYCNEDTEQ